MKEMMIKLFFNGLALASPAIVDMVQGMAYQLYQRALKTSNPVDDFFAGLFCAIVGVNVDTYQNESEVIR